MPRHCVIFLRRSVIPLIALCALALTNPLWAQSAAQGKSAVAATMPESDVENFAIWEDSAFSTFFYDTTADFARYDKAIFFPMTFDRMALSGTGNDEFVESWQKSSFKEMNEICQFFDDYVEKKFKRSDVLESTRQGGPNVLAIEFRMKDFMPTSSRREDALDTVGQSTNALGVGVLTFQAVLVESQTGKLIAVIEDGLEIKSSSFSIDNRVGRNLAWKRSFQRVAGKLRDDLARMQGAPRGEHR